MGNLRLGFGLEPMTHSMQSEILRTPSLIPNYPLVEWDNSLQCTMDFANSFRVKSFWAGKP